MNPSAHPAALAAALVIALASGLRAQEAANATTKWRLTYHTHISAWVSDDEEIFDTKAEAERKAAILRQTNASNDPGSPVPFTNIRIAPITVPAAAASGVAALIADVEGRLGRIGESLDHLREIANEILDAAERKPGAALADYANSIRDAYRRVSDLREKLLAQQTELGKEAIRAVNRQIDEYNAQADAFNAFLKSPPNSVRLAMVPTRRTPKPNSSFRGNRTPVEQDAPLTLPQPAQRIERLQESSAKDSDPRGSPKTENGRKQEADSANDGKQMLVGAGVVGRWVGDMTRSVDGSTTGKLFLDLHFHADGRLEWSSTKGGKDAWSTVHMEWKLTEQGQISCHPYWNRSLQFELQGDLLTGRELLDGGEVRDDFVLRQR